MKKESVLDAFKSNWYLFLGLVVCIAGAVFMAIRSDEAEPHPTPSGQFTSTGGRQSKTPDVIGEMNREQQSREEQVRATIQAHQEKVDNNPNSDEAPALVMAMGNLYRQKLRDYQSASQCYERLLEAYPDWPSVRGVYIELATCYERMEDSDNARWTYERMMEKFPEDSAEYEYARAKVRREIE